MAFFRGLVGGCLCTSLIFLSSFLGSIFILGPIFPLIFIKRAWYRKIVDNIIAFWESYAVALLEVGFGMTAVVTGDMIRPDETALIIMNHRTRLDWLFLWSCLLRFSHLSKHKVIMKSSLKHIPGAGWAMQMACFIFIDRKWDRDKIILSNVLNYFRETSQSVQVLLFPEGTDLNAISKSRSDAYASKQGLQYYNNVLHPRTTGFTYIIQTMRQDNNLDAVYDVTVGYPHAVPQIELDIIRGHVPDLIHFHIKRYAQEELPSLDSELQVWCEQRWEEKEKLLAHFQDKKTFEASNKFLIGIEPCIPLYLSFTIWTAMVVGWMVLLAYSCLVRWYLVLCTTVYVAIALYCGGIEQLEIILYDKEKVKDR